MAAAINRSTERIETPPKGCSLRLQQFNEIVKAANLLMFCQS
jgi:hypothetical protein